MLDSEDAIDLSTYVIQHFDMLDDDIVLLLLPLRTASASRSPPTSTRDSLMLSSFSFS